MPEITIHILTKKNAGPFAPYLIPQARQYLGEGKELLALGASAQGHSLGAVAALVQDDMLHIASLYVDPAVRRQGVATLLLRALGARVRALGLAPYAAGAYYMEEDEDVNVISAFLQSAGFETPQLSYRLFCVSSADVREMPRLRDAFSSSYQPDPHVRPFSAITQEQLAEIEADDTIQPTLKPSGMHFNVRHSASAIWVQDGHVLGWVLSHQAVDGEVVLAAAVTRDGAPLDSFFKLLSTMLNRWYLMLGRDYRVYVLTLTPRVAALLEKITGGHFHEYNHYMARTGDELPGWLSGEETM